MLITIQDNKMNWRKILGYAFLGGVVTALIMVFQPALLFPTRISEIPAYLLYVFVPGFVVGACSALFGASKKSITLAAILVGAIFPFGLTLGVILTGKFDEPPTLIDNLVIYSTAMLSALVVGSLPILFELWVRSNTSKH